MFTSAGGEPTNGARAPLSKSFTEHSSVPKNVGWAVALPDGVCVGVLVDGGVTLEVAPGLAPMLVVGVAVCVEALVPDCEDDGVSVWLEVMVLVMVLVMVDVIVAVIEEEEVIVLVIVLVMEDVIVAVIEELELGVPVSEEDAVTDGEGVCELDEEGDGEVVAPDDSDDEALGVGVIVGVRVLAIDLDVERDAVAVLGGEGGGAEGVPERDLGVDVPVEAEDAEEEPVPDWLLEGVRVWLEDAVPLDVWEPMPVALAEGVIVGGDCVTDAVSDGINVLDGVGCMMPTARLSSSTTEEAAASASPTFQMRTCSV